MLVANIQEEGRFGGPQKRIAEVAKGCLELGCRTVSIIPKQDSEKFQNLLTKYDIDYELISMHRLTREKSHLFKYFIFFPFEVFRIYKVLKRIKPDVVHCNGSFQIKGAIAAKFAGVKSVWHMNDTMTMKPIYILFSFLKKYFGDKFVAASIRSGEYYFPDVAESMSILPAPVMTDDFSPFRVENIKEISSLEGINVVSVGNVNPVKGFDTFVNAAVYLKDRTDAKVNFIIVGPLLDNQKVLSEKLFSIINDNGLDNVHFLGRRNDVPSVLKSCDIYVCSSRFEASPISVWEAMSMGMPIVSTDVGDVKSVFSEFDCGICVDIDDPIAMGEGILTYINDEKLMSKNGLKAREVAVNHFDIKQCCKKHYDIYRDTIKEI